MSAPDPFPGSRDFVVLFDGDVVPPALSRAVVAIGNFDGVHRGHQALIARALEEARRARVPAAVLTFEPHPRQFFAPEKPLFRLTPQPEKLRIFGKLGLDGVFVRRFDATLAGTTAAEFVERLLVGELAASAVVVGHDFHFGKGREGTPAVLAALCQRFDLGCIVIPPVTAEDEPISSSLVRAALAAGDVARANALLGYRWFVEGEVGHGDKRGRVLGFPTANLRLPPSCGLRHGIYAIRIALDDGIRGGVASFGRRPTFDNGPPLLEVFLFDFEGDLYGRRVQVEFVAWIRGEERFATVEALVAQMQRDSQAARQALAGAGKARSMLA